MALLASPPRSVWGPQASRPSTAPAFTATSPRKRGELSKQYHTKYHHGNIIEQDPAAAREAGSPKIVLSKKPGMAQFSDPTNPSGRTKAKLMTNLQDHRNDARRAGGRTRDAGMIPCGDVDRSVDATEPKRPGFVAYRYSTDVAWRPSKRCPDASIKQTATSEGLSGAFHATSPRQSSGVAQSMAHIPEPGRNTSVLDNYLNDMKKTGGGKRKIAGQPSGLLQKMNDERFCLPAERNAGKGIQRSVSCDPRLESRSPLFGIGNQDDATTDKATHPFGRKSPVVGNWTHGRSDLLAHVEQSKDHSEPASNRAAKANQRFDQLVSHMANKNPTQRTEFGSIKDLGTRGQGIFNGGE